MYAYVKDVHELIGLVSLLFAGLEIESEREKSKWNWFLVALSFLLFENVRTSLISLQRLSASIV